MKLKPLTIALALAALGSAAFVHFRRADPRVEDVRLAVFQQQVGFWLDEQARQAGTVACLAIEDGGVRRSVPKDYLDRFPERDPVRTSDECEERASGAVERGTGRPAVLVTVGKVEWKSPGEAWVTTRHYRSALASGVRIQRVVREDTRWVCLGQIIKDTPL
jgi:hypothetical protein